MHSIFVTICGHPELSVGSLNLSGSKIVFFGTTGGWNYPENLGEIFPGQFQRFPDSSKAFPIIPTPPVVAIHCLDFDECSAGICDENARCVNTLGSFDCFCRTD